MVLLAQTASSAPTGFFEVIIKTGYTPNSEISQQKGQPERARVLQAPFRQASFDPRAADLETLVFNYCSGRLAFWFGILAYPNVHSKKPNTWLQLKSIARCEIMMVGQSSDTDCNAGRRDSQSVLGRATLDSVTLIKRPFAVDQALPTDTCMTCANDRGQSNEVRSWPDATLVAAVRSDPADEAALDALVERYWPRLFARCQLMTQCRQQAADLAQEAWHRILSRRHTLKPEGNFQAYLMTVAANLWRDSNRSARRAGAMADHRLLSRDATSLNDGGETASFGDLLPDSKSLQAEQSKLSEMDIDQAFAQLTPLLCDVLLSRFVIGESCGEIGRRYSRTEQTVFRWLREAIRQMNQFLLSKSSNIKPSAVRSS